MTKEISIVIPAFNAEATLGAAISSALNQSIRSVEIIVVDDCSTDSTSTIAEAYSGLGVRLLRSAQNGGPAAARNLGIATAVAPRIGFLDADDFLFPTWAASMIGLLDNGADIAVANALELHADGEIERTSYYDNLTFPAPPQQARAILRDNFILSTCAVWRHCLPDEGFNACYRGVEDWDLWMRILLKGGEASLDPAPRSLYWRRPDSLSSATATMHQQELALLETASRFTSRSVLDPLERARRRGISIRSARQAIRDSDLVATSRPLYAARLALTASLVLRQPRLLARAVKLASPRRRA